jgi:hypothetical protein
MLSGVVWTGMTLALATARAGVDFRLESAV